MIRLANPSDNIRLLWDKCFPDDGSNFNDYFFENILHDENVLLYIENDKIVAMLQRIPFTASFEDKTHKLTYIYGACTDPDFRKRGFMPELLEESFRYDVKEGVVASFLIPAEDWLFGYYERFGYKTAFFQTNLASSLKLIDTCGFELVETTINDIPTMDKIYKDRCGDFSIIRDSDFWCKQIDMFHKVGLNALNLKLNGAIVGYAFLWKSEHGIWAQEMMCYDDIQYSIFSQLIREKYNVETVKITTNTSENKDAVGCIKLHSNIKIYDNSYINLLFN